MPQRITLFRVRDELRWVPGPRSVPHAQNNANAGISLFWGCAMLTLIQAKIKDRETRGDHRLRAQQNEAQIKQVRKDISDRPGGPAPKHLHCSLFDSWRGAEDSREMAGRLHGPSATVRTTRFCEQLHLLVLVRRWRLSEPVVQVDVHAQLLSLVR
jgi:hypothetical protein